MPPISTLGSTPPSVSTHPVSAAVVVLPCVPAMTIECAPQRKCSLIASGNEQYPHLSVEHLLELDVAAGNGIPDNHEIEVVGNVLGAVPAERRNALGSEKIAHRRVDVLIGATDVEPLMFEQRGQRRSGRPADTDDMDPLTQRPPLR